MICSTDEIAIESAEHAQTKAAANPGPPPPFPLQSLASGRVDGLALADIDVVELLRDLIRELDLDVVEADIARSEREVGRAFRLDRIFHVDLMPGVLRLPGAGRPDPLHRHVGIAIINGEIAARVRNRP